jgi:hypothetical protein
MSRQRGREEGGERGGERGLPPPCQAQVGGAGAKVARAAGPGEGTCMGKSGHRDGQMAKYVRTSDPGPNVLQKEVRGEKDWNDPGMLG